MPSVVSNEFISWCQRNHDVTQNHFLDCMHFQFYSKINATMLLCLYQIPISLLGHLHFFLHLFFTFMENLFDKHPMIAILSVYVRIPRFNRQFQRMSRASLFLSSLVQTLKFLCTVEKKFVFIMFFCTSIWKSPAIFVLYDVCIFPEGLASYLKSRRSMVLFCQDTFKKQ